MIPDIRKKINSEFTDAKYSAFIHELNTTYKYAVEFRPAETPVFLTKDVKRQLVEACSDIVGQLQTEQFKKHSCAAIPEGLSVPNETPHPVFLQIDFGICTDAHGNFIPQLIELQGFPSLYGYQAFLNDTIRKHFPIPPTYGASFNGFVRESYEKLLREVIVGDSDPAHVVLLEIEPERQKTRIDFVIMERMLGIRTVCLTKVIKRGKQLFYHNDGKEIRIERIYNRVIFDELIRKKIRSEFTLTDDVDVHWVGHPNWYFRVSKQTLPLLRGRYVPECHFVNELDDYPSDLHNYVLKPLYSFAGIGVDIDVRKEKLDRLTDKSQYLLQRKVEYADLIATPDGYAKAEVRMMFVWPEGPNAATGLEKGPILVKNLVRLSKGRMMGVDFNKYKTWVGSTIAYHEPL